MSGIQFISHISSYGFICLCKTFRLLSFGFIAQKVLKRLQIEKQIDNRFSFPRKEALFPSPRSFFTSKVATKMSQVCFYLLIQSASHSFHKSAVNFSETLIMEGLLAWILIDRIGPMVNTWGCQYIQINRWLWRVCLWLSKLFCQWCHLLVDNC